MTTVVEMKPARPDKIAASIEVAPRQAVESADLPNLFPKGTHVYVTDVGTDTTDTLVAAARRLRELGFEPVPHFASRRLTTRPVLEDRIKRMSEEAGVNNVLVIGGGLERQAGEFSSTMEVLETGYFDKYGVSSIGVAGHPEGSPDFSEEVAVAALRLKKSFAERSDAQLRIVTQFGFDAQKFISWADSLKGHGIDLPVHLGVAGPAKITTLLKFAAMCGVGNSVSFLKKNALSLTTLATSHSPENVVGPIETHVLSGAATPIRQIHVFAFGGLKKTSEWLEDRGTWDIKTSLYPSTSSTAQF
ncbi:methylenetetrahydrofolate reductase [Hoeflea prorocentri]|uniref:Methylenetetrahydrofolate reductase n=1 Tax=Hoeflea prorocentri TaxID=1922333 RepID=A0A9X3UEX1_9HYPH|nr:methylenetetrahydrofolate reductase [Hoeflea prorocentri]MCY6380042.1 methylenetetrahydrofolate reductase [Hoeflea prorocentri]MDA5397842.1 methylenetetrahydrofolate reductase [Hoeflea prorocentri]